MPIFRASAWDINTNTKLTDLPGATSLHYSERINDAGEFGFDLNLSDAQARATAQILRNLGGNEFKTIITANADTTILYAGIGQQSAMASKNTFISFAGKALPAWFSQVVIANSYTTAVSPGQLIANAVTDAQNVGPGANRGIVPVLIGSARQPNITPSYNVNQRTTVAQVIADQTAGITPGTGGTDYYMSHVFTNGAPAHQMNIISPRSGRDHNTSGLSVNLGQAIDWTWPTENTQSGNHIIVVGSGTGGVQPVATADTSTPRGGLGQPPRKDLVLQYSQVSIQSQLQNIANGSVQRFGQPITTPTVTIPATYAPCALGAFMIGDDVRLDSGPSIWFPNGLSQWWRIVAYDVTVPDAGVPTVTLTLNQPPVF